MVWDIGLDAWQKHSNVKLSAHHRIQLSFNYSLSWYIFSSNYVVAFQVDPSGPLATLRKLLLSYESMRTLKEWVIQHWWGVLLLALGFIIFLVRICL